MSNKHKGKARIEFTAEEIERLFLMVKEAIEGKPLQEVLNSPLPMLFLKLKRGYHQIKVPAKEGDSHELP